MKKRLFTIVVAVMALVAVAGCKQQAGQADSVSASQEALEGFTDTVSLQIEPMKTPESQTFSQTLKKAAKPVAAPAPVAKPKAVKATGTPETIYVETDGAQGRVWGHVTMRGDRGTGTIHDWDENTLSVSVTRHGNELFAVDQNSRQYVFKLKK